MQPDAIRRALLENNAALLQELPGEQDGQHGAKIVPFRIEDIPSVWQCVASIKWIIEGLIPAAAVTLLCGDSGIGKSTLALALAGAVAHGKPFLGRATAQRPVLYVDRANPLS